ncbi:MAG: SEL1-like repeat protein [archaeon]|nr:SEL1-like repeat protein [archaeon]
MAQSEELLFTTAGRCTDESFSQAQQLAIGGKREAFDLYLKSAMQGNAASAFMVSQYLVKGLVPAEQLDILLWAAYASVGYQIPATRWIRRYCELRDPPADGVLFEHCLKKGDEGNGAALFLAGMAHYVGIGTYFDPAKAYGLFERSAALGNLDGQCQMALCLIRGSGVDRDVAKGRELLEDAVSKGNIRAGLKMAYLLEHGNGIRKDRKAAFELYVAMANNKVPIAMYEAGRCCMDGIGTDRDENMAYAWFYASQRMGCPEGDFGMARCMLGGIVEDKREEGLKLLMACAENGCTDALTMLGQLYNKGGKIVKKDVKAAMECFKKAADLGKASSEVFMSNCYASGEGVRKDLQTSVRYALRAAAHGNAEGCYIAGNALMTGTGIKKDEKRGFALCAIASEEGYMKATYHIATCYSRGKVVKKDSRKAFELHKELSDKGFLKSTLHVAEAYYHGDGVKADVDEAFRLFKIGAEKDNVFCQYYLGDCYDKGNGVKKDPAAALKWYKKAADQGHIISQRILEERKSQEILDDESPFASFEKRARGGDAQSMFILGRYYESGIGIERDLHKAREWYTKAKKRGNAAAKRALEALDKKQ